MRWRGHSVPNLCKRICLKLLHSQGCARFAESLQNFSERQILWSLCSVVFRALTSKLPNQTSLSVAPKLPVSLSSAENCHKFRKTSTPQVVGMQNFRHKHLYMYLGVNGIARTITRTEDTL